ncbi:MAG: hypothetical protein AB1763_05000 [Campylobacterota bacterium]
MSAKPAFTYAQYLKSVGGVAGMTEQQFNEAFGITPDDVVPPLQITPKRSVSSSIDNHAKIAAEAKERRRKKPAAAKVPKEPKPKKDHVVQVHEMIKKPKKEKVPKEPKPKKEKVPKEPKPKFRPRGKYSTLSEEERRLIRNARQREYRRKRMESGAPKRTYTEEQRIRQREYSKQYYLSKKQENPDYVRQKQKELRERMKAEGRSNYKKVPPELRKKADFSSMTLEQISEHKKRKQKEAQARHYQKHKAVLNQKRKLYKSSSTYKSKEATKARERRAAKKSPEATSTPPTSGTTTTRQ